MESNSFPAIKFENVGDIRELIVRKVDQKIDIDMATQLPKTWPNGDPVHVFVFTGEADGETKSMWVRGNLVKVLREAVTAAGLKSVIDTKVTVKFDSVGEPPQRGFSGPKLFKAKVEKVDPAPVDDRFSNQEEPF